MRKIIFTFLHILLIIGLYSFKTIPKNYRGYTKKELALKIDKVRTIKSSVKRSTFKRDRLKEELVRLKKINSFSPSFDNEFESIATFERFMGIIDGNIISSGQPVNFKVDFLSSRKIPEGSYLSCTGTNLISKYNYRIIASCDHLITPSDEFKVNVSIKDLKKVDGIAPDHVYTGDEEAIMGEGFSAIMAGIIDARKDVVKTSIGFSPTPSMKNTYLNGLKSGARLANQKAKEHSSNQTVVLGVKDNTKIIIEFKRRFSYEDDTKI